MGGGGEKKDLGKGKGRREGRKGEGEKKLSDLEVYSL